MHADSISLRQKKAFGSKRSTADQSLSFTISETSAQSSRRLHERTVIFPTRFDYALVIVTFQTGAIQLMTSYILVEKYGGVVIFLTTCALTIVISLPLMVQQIFYGFYNKFGYIKFWNIAPVAFGIGLSMAIYSIYECVVWSAIAGLLILHMCYIPFRSISEWTSCRKIERPEGMLCYDTTSELPSTSCDHTTYPGFEFYIDISYKPQEERGINSAWFVCCFLVWLIIFVMVSQGFRRLKHILIKVPILCSFSSILLFVFSFCTQENIVRERKNEISHAHESFTRNTIIWLVWHAIRVIQIPLGTLYQLGSYSPPTSSLLADAVMILAFVWFYNFAFSYFAHSCHTWVEAKFINIEPECLTPNIMTALFASVPTAISFLAMGNLWLFVFYTALTLKTIIQIVITLTATMNAMSETFHLHRHRQQIVAVLCTVALLMNLPLTMTNSETFFNQINQLVEILVDLTIVFFGSLVILCLYDLSRVFDDIHFSYNAEPVMFQKFISYLSPVLITVAFFNGFATVVSNWHTNPAFTTNSATAPLVGIAIFLLLAPIPAFALYMYIVHLMKHNISAMLQPTSIWGPPEADVKQARLIFNPHSELRYKSKKPCTHNCLLNNLRIKIEVEKRDSQRKEFFLNVFQSPSYAEWDDVEDWRYGVDILGKARAVDDWAGDFGTHRFILAEELKVSNPMTAKEGDEEQRRNEAAEHNDEKIQIEDTNDPEENINSEKDPEKNGKTKDNTVPVNVVLVNTFILKEDTHIESGMDGEPVIILPDFNSNGLYPRIRHLDTYDVAHRTPRSPRYTGECRPYVRRRRSKRERLFETQIEPPPNTTMYKSMGRAPKRQSTSKSCQTDKGLKRLKNLVQTILPWKRNNRKKHRCVGTNPDGWPETGCIKQQTSGSSSEGSETLSETDEWP